MKEKIGNAKLHMNNKGFSLIELIIVIAIMAVLVGTVGMQVIPYLNNAKKARDIQVLSAYATAGVVAYSEKIESVSTDLTSMKVIIQPGSGNTDVYICSDAQAVADEMKFLIDKNYLSDDSKPFKSKAYRNIDKIEVEFDFENAKVTVKAYEGSEEKSIEDDISALL